MTRGDGLVTVPPLDAALTHSGEECVEVPDDPNGREVAIVAAGVALVRPLGFTVESVAHFRAERRDGRTQKVLVLERKGSVERIAIPEPDIAHWRDAGKGKTCARIAVTEAGWRHLQRQRRGWTLLVYRCTAQKPHAGACSGAMRDRVHQAAVRYAKRLAPTIVDLPRGTELVGERIWKLQEHHDAAYILLVKLENARYATLEGGFHYADCDLGFALFAPDGAAVGSFTDTVEGAFPETSGGQRIPPSRAVEVAVENAVKKLEEELEWFKKPQVGGGSLPAPAPVPSAHERSGD